MKELIDYLVDAANGKNPTTAIAIPTLEIKKRLGNAQLELGKMLFWLAGYYQLLKWLKTKAKLTPEARRDFNNVETFLKFFDDNDRTEGEQNILDLKGGEK